MIRTISRSLVLGALLILAVLILQPQAPVAADGLVLRGVVCETPIYDQPGGTPVGNNRIFPGQTWFFLTEFKFDSFGRAWVGMITGGPNIGFIPAECVEGSGVGFGFGTGGAVAPVQPSMPRVIGPGNQPSAILLGPNELGYYRIRRGDTLGGIAKRFGVSLQQLIRLNGIRNPDLIYEGRILAIPPVG